MINRGAAVTHITLMRYKDIPKGYAQIVNAIECGLKGETEKMRWFVELYIKRYPKGAYFKPFNHFITGEPQPDLGLLGDIPRIDLSKYAGTYTTNEAREIAKKIEQEITPTVKRKNGKI